MNTTIYNALLLLLVFTINTNAQNSGFLLLDSETKEPIPYANICLENLQNGKAKYTISSLVGVFNNPCNGKAKIAISFAGYQTIIDTIYPNNTKTYLLEPDIFNLSQVVVTATRTEKSLKDVPVITQVISAKQIENQGFTNMSEVLSAEVPGFDFQRVGFGTDVSVQGMGAKNILILVDGEPLAGENGNNIDYSRLNTDNIAKVEIVKGASSALYGSQAMGGVINIITKEPRKRLELSIGGKYKGYNQINYHDLDDSDGDYFYKWKLDLPNVNLNATLGFNVGKISGQTVVSAKSFDAYQLVNDYNQVVDIINIDTSITLPAETTNVYGYEDLTVSQKLKFKPSQKWEIDLKGSYYIHNQYDFQPDNTYQQFKDISYGGGVKYKAGVNTDIYVSINRDSYDKYNFYEKLNERELNYTNTFIHPKAIVTSSVIDNHEVTVGGELLNEYLLSDKFHADTLIDETINTSVLFFQDDFDINSNLNITTGARADYHTAFGLHVSPKASLMYKYGNHRFRLNYATGFRSPTLKELYMEWDLMGMFTIKGDENLQPETNQYISASAEYTKNKLNGSINIYNNWFKNKIEGEWQNNQTVYQYVNLGSNTLTGVEVMLKYHLLKHFNITGGYSFINDDRSADSQMSVASPHSATTRLEYHFSKGVYNMNINIAGKFTGSKDFQAFEPIIYEGEIVDAWYNLHYDAFSIWNLSFSQRLYNSANIIFSIDNMFNYQPDIVDFHTTINPGRRYSITVQVDIDRFFNTTR